MTKEQKHIYARIYYVKHRDEILERQKEWKKTNSSIWNGREILRRRKRRKQVLDHYGGKCVCCGETIYEFLTFDHINGGGNKHRKEIKGPMERWLKINNYPKEFQVLCYNCNSAKGHHGKCPHESQAGLELESPANNSPLGNLRRLV